MNTCTPSSHGPGGCRRVVAVAGDKSQLLLPVDDSHSRRSWRRVSLSAAVAESHALRSRCFRLATFTAVTMVGPTNQGRLMKTAWVSRSYLVDRSRWIERWATPTGGEAPLREPRRPGPHARLRGDSGDVVASCFELLETTGLFMRRPCPPARYVPAIPLCPSDLGQSPQKRANASPVYRLLFRHARALSAPYAYSSCSSCTTKLSADSIQTNNDPTESLRTPRNNSSSGDEIEPL
jgi:hypothetical protein